MKELLHYCRPAFIELASVLGIVVLLAFATSKQQGRGSSAFSIAFWCSLLIWIGWALLHAGEVMYEATDSSTSQPMHPTIQLTLAVLIPLFALFLPLLVTYWRNQVSEAASRFLSLHTAYRACAKDADGAKEHLWRQMRALYLSMKSWRDQTKDTRAIVLSLLLAGLCLFFWQVELVSAGTPSAAVGERLSAISALTVFGIVAEAFVFQLLFTHPVQNRLETELQFMENILNEEETVSPPADRRKPWNLMAFIVSGAIAALTFGVSFLLGSAITSSVGPGMSGIATIIVTTAIVVAGAKIVDRFGVMLLIILLFAAMSIPTTMFGPPGPLKLLVGLATGVFYEITIWVLRRTRLAFAIAGGLGAATAIAAIWLLLIALHAQGAAKIADAAKYIFVLYFVLGVIGGLFGYMIWERSLKHLAIVRQISGPDSDSGANA
jgi:hypothetical protein